MKNNIKNEDYKAKPILRFLARSIDSIIYGGIITVLFSIYFFILGFLGGDINFMDNIHKYVIYVIYIILYIIVETIVLTTFQTTAGKKFLNISIKKIDNSQILFKNSLKRTVLVWIRGLGLAIPLVSFVTHLVAYGNLSTDNYTSWDKDSNFKVINNSVETWRIAVASIIAIIAIAIMVYLKLEVTI